MPKITRETPPLWESLVADVGDPVTVDPVASSLPMFERGDAWQPFFTDGAFDVPERSAGQLDVVNEDDREQEEGSCSDT